MNINLLLFGITTDLLGTSSLNIELESNSSVADFKLMMQKKYPQLVNLHSYAIAVNEEYAQDDVLLKENDVVAIIPPVSGG